MLIKLEKLLEQDDTRPLELIDAIMGRRESGAFKMTTTRYQSGEYLELYHIKRSTPDYLWEEPDLEAQKQFFNDDMQLIRMVREMQRLQEENDIDHCMYRVYEQMSDWSAERRLSLCDRLLKAIEVEDYDMHILLSLLMASFPMRKRLSFRSEFFGRVLERARRIYSEEEIHDIFVGLD